jgi:uncharacterized protein
MADDPRLLEGVAAFNAAQFFAAHEIWEALWLETVGPEKILLQGLVQIAAGYAKAESGLRSGALKLLSAGMERIRQSLPNANGLVLDDFLQGVAADVERLQRTNTTTVGIEMLHIPPLRQEPGAD